MKPFGQAFQRIEIDQRDPLAWVALLQSAAAERAGQMDRYRCLPRTPLALRNRDDRRHGGSPDLEGDLKSTTVFRARPRRTTAKTDGSSSLPAAADRLRRGARGSAPRISLSKDF